MILQYLQYRYVKARLSAYLEGDLPLAARRYIARQLDENPLCYREYIAMKQARQELEQTLPIFGAPQPQDLNHIWAAIQTDMKNPAPHQNIASLMRYPFSYGMTVVLIVLVLITPFILDFGRVSGLPEPQFSVPNHTNLTLPASTAEAPPRIIALAVETETQTNKSQIPLQNTPAPHTPVR